MTSIILPSLTIVLSRNYSSSSCFEGLAFLDLEMWWSIVWFCILFNVESAAITITGTGASVFYY